MVGIRSKLLTRRAFVTADKCLNTITNDRLGSKQKGTNKSQVILS